MIFCFLKNMSITTRIVLAIVRRCCSEANSEAHILGAYLEEYVEKHRTNRKCPCKLYSSNLQKKHVG